MATTQQPRTGSLSTWAIASLALGAVGLTLVATNFGLISLLGVIAGHAARADIQRNHLRGAGLATAGLVLGYLALALIMLVAFGNSI